jgi:hypothetical protein
MYCHLKLIYSLLSRITYKEVVNLCLSAIFSSNSTHNFQRRSPPSGRMATIVHIPQESVHHIYKVCIFSRSEQSGTLLWRRRRPWKHWSFRTREASYVCEGEPGRLRCREEDRHQCAPQLHFSVRGSAEHVPWLPVRYFWFALHCTLHAWSNSILLMSLTYMRYLADFRWPSEDCN